MPGQLQEQPLPVQVLVQLQAQFVRLQPVLSLIAGLLCKRRVLRGYPAQRQELVRQLEV